MFIRSNCNRPWRLVSVSCTMLSLGCSLAAAALPSGPLPPPATTPQEQSAVMQVQDAFISIAQDVEPAVVNIRSERPDTASQTIIVGPLPHKALPKGPDTSPTPGPLDSIVATGSGVIVRSDGYILTNDHVVDGARNGIVTVTLSDGEQFQGKIYTDYQSDLAIVKINPGGLSLPVVTFANSSTVQPGQWAIAIGSPFDLQNTMTVGVISALHRQQTINGDTPNAERYYPDLIQTDAPINPGNSGGPLFNIDGQVVGINVAIESPVEGSSGVGFAIPSNTATQIATDLITTGKVVRGQLGIVPTDLSPALQQMYGQKRGAFITDVVLTGPGGKPTPAAAAGLRAADIITSFNGTPIKTELDLRKAIASTPPGTRVQIVYVRDNHVETTIATIGTAPPDPQNVIQKINTTATASNTLGLKVRDLTATDRTTNGFPPLTQGVLITGTVTGTPADMAGLGLPDAVGKVVIQRVNQTRVDNVTEYNAAVAALKPGSIVALTIYSKADNALHQSVIMIQL